MRDVGVGAILSGRGRARACECECVHVFFEPLRCLCVCVCLVGCLVPGLLSRCKIWRTTLKLNTIRVR